MQPNAKNVISIRRSAVDVPRGPELMKDGMQKKVIIQKLNGKQHQKDLQDRLACCLLIAAIAAHHLCAWHVTVVKRDRYVPDASTDSWAQKMLQRNSQIVPSVT